MERDGSLLDDYVLSLTDGARPRVCFLPTASGDADHYVVRFYRRMRAGFAFEDRVALHFRRTRLKRVVSSRPGAYASRVQATADGVRERRLRADYLGDSEDASGGPTAERAPGRACARGPRDG